MIGDTSIANGNIELSIIAPTESGAINFSKASSTTATTATDSFSERSDNQTVNTTDTIPIRIQPGTKNLVLARKLDKESVEGESSVIIGIRCRPKRKMSSKKVARKFVSDDDLISGNGNAVEGRINPASDPSSYWIYDTDSSRDEQEDDIIIPIRIMVTDANDNRPEWQGTIPYTVNISEMATVGSVAMSGIRAIDNDQLGPYSTVEYYVEPGPYSHLLRFASPLEGTLILASSLDYETLPQFWIGIRAQDQGNPPNMASTKVEVTVIDADDQNPRFEVDKYTVSLAEGQRPDAPLVVQPKPIKAEDPDRAIRSPIIYEFNSDDTREYSYFKIDPNTGVVTLRKPLTNSVSLPLTLVIRATQLDNRDRYALTTLTIFSKRHQVMPELRFLHTNYSASLLESTPAGQVLLTVQTSRQHDSPSDSMRFQLLDDDEGYFAIRNTGEIIVKKQLDYEKHHRYSFRAMVTDGRQSDVARVTIDILNVNEHDPVFSQSSYVFHVNEARLRSSPVIGQIQATDADDGDRIQITLSGPHASAFALSADGTLRLRSLKLVNTSECHLIATARDSGSPPRSSSASVVVKFSPQLLKSFTSRTLDTSGWKFLFELNDNDLDSERSSSISPTAADILQHSAANIFTASTNSTALVLVIVLGVLLGTLFIIIVALTLHVLKNRKYESSGGEGCSPTPSTVLHHHHHGTSSASSTTSSSSSSNLSLHSGHRSSHQYQMQRQPDTKRNGFLSTSMFSPSAVAITRSSKVAPLAPPYSEDKELTNIEEEDDSKFRKQDCHDSAISSDISSDNNKSLESGNGGDNQRPHSSSSTDSSTEVPPGRVTSTINQGTMGSRISVIRWPQGSIPRRVKKLTWKDEQRNNHLDQMYTSNSTVPVGNSGAKTKTLSGHLLTGTTSAPPPSTHLASYAIKSRQQPPTAHFGQLMPKVESSEETTGHFHTSGHHFHHVHHAHHHHHHERGNSPNPTTLPDLTVYF